MGVKTCRFICKTWCSLLGAGESENLASFWIVCCLCVVNVMLACSCNSLVFANQYLFLKLRSILSCVIDPRHLNNDGSTSFQRLKDLFVRDRPMFEVAALVFLTQPAPSVLRQLSECEELRARLFGMTEFVEAGETKTKSDPHVLILDQHCVQMSESVFALNSSVGMELQRCTVFCNRTLAVSSHSQYLSLPLFSMFFQGTPAQTI